MLSLFSQIEEKCVKEFREFSYVIEPASSRHLKMSIRRIKKNKDAWMSVWNDWEANSLSYVENYLVQLSTRVIKLMTRNLYCRKLDQSFNIIIILRIATVWHTSYHHWMICWIHSIAWMFQCLMFLCVNSIRILLWCISK